MRKLLLVLAVALAAGLIVVVAMDPLVVEEPDAPAGDPESRRADPVAEPGGTRVGTGEASGRVWRAGVPAAARVEAWAVEAGGAAGSAPVAAADAGTSGVFLLRGLPVGIYQLRAIAGDGAACSAFVRIRHPSERAVVDLTIPSGRHTLRGRVAYEDGRPFRGLVTVSPTGTSRGGPVAPGLETDEEGRFAARWLVTGTVRVRCRVGEDFLYAGRLIRIPHEGEILIVVDRGAVDLAGRVTAEDDGSPVAGAEVTVSGDSGGDRSCVVRVRTDEDGRFRLRVFRSRRRMEVRADGFSPVERSLEREDESVEIRLGRAGSVAGRVLSAESRAPLSGVPVVWVPLDPWHILDGGRVVSGAGGRFSIPEVPNGPVMIYARGGGRISAGIGSVVDGGANPLIVTIEPGSVAEVDLLAIRAVRVRGRLVDDRGAAAPGVPIRVKRWVACDILSKIPSETVSGPGGEFVFDGLAPGVPHYLEASPPGRAKVHSAILEGSAGEELEVTLEVPSEDSPPRWIDLSVVELTSGEPVAGANVSAGRRGGRTSSNGRARIGPLGPGRVSVWVYHPDYALLQNRPLVPESSTGLIPVTVRLRRGLSITGRVLLPDGRPLENGTVWITSADADDSAPGRTDIGEVTAGGRFRASGLLAGRYKLKIGGSHDDGGYWVTAVAEAGDDDLVLTTERYVGPEEQRLVLRVVDTEGNPVPAATAELRFEGDGQSWSNDFEILGGTGYYPFYDQRGTVTISVHGARTLSGASLPLAPVLEGPMPLRFGEMTIRLPAEKAITGVVREAGGEGVAGVMLTATPAHAEELEFDDDHAVAFTDASGAFRLGGLGEAAYLISIAAPEEFLPAEPVSAKGGAADVRIRLTRGSAFRLTVVDPDARAVPGAGIHVEAEDGRGFSAYTRRDGVGVLRGIDADLPLTLSVSPPSGRGDLLPVTRADWRPGDATIALEAGLPVAGVVRDPDGRPAFGAIARACGESGTWLEQPVAQDGSFRLGPFRPGSVTLMTRWQGVPVTRPAPGPVEVAAGREDVVLTAHAGRSLTVRILNWAATFGPARARLTGVGGTRWTVVEPNGTATFRGLPPEGDSSIWVGPVGDGLYLHRTLPAGEPVIEATLVRGGTVEGHVTWPPGARDPEVRIDGPGYSMNGAVEEDGTFRFPGLPPGKCVVTARAIFDRRRIEAHAWTQPGERVEIVLEGEVR